LGSLCLYVLDVGGENEGGEALVLAVSLHGWLEGLGENSDHGFLVQVRALLSKLAEMLVLVHLQVLIQLEQVENESLGVKR